MDEDWKETLDFESKDTLADRRVKLTLVSRVEEPTPAAESDAQFEKLMQALWNRRDRQRRRHRLITYALSSAAAILACVAILQFLFR